MKKTLFLLFWLFTSPAFAQSDSVATDAETMFVDPEIPASFPGGDQALQKFLSDNLQYPKAAKDNGYAGTVYVNFKITTEGKMTDIQVVKGVKGSPELSEEAMRLMKIMPDWIPGRLNGKPVVMRCNVPVKFILR